MKEVRVGLGWGVGRVPLVNEDRSPCSSTAPHTIETRGENVVSLNGYLHCQSTEYVWVFRV